ncbi:hypothetical protein SAMN04488058_10350 [Deinococcus reticulitermitis]|uniref:Uncharacterized protein n=2 Tax=Deinococcus reticulitermitis TaxID=856736 RepID=A0A1H6V566_9DEIO|nr:hypothetical protein SAMN04488058_10350 [Deinococcus reticulitermitis]
MMAGPAFLSAALVLAACGSPPVVPEPEPQPTEQAGAILGQITPIGQDTQIRAEIEGIRTGVDSQGKFGLTLPDVATMTSTYQNDLLPVYQAPTPPNESGDSVFGLCTSVTQDAPDDLKVYPINELRTDTGRTLVQNRAPNSQEGLKLRTWWFSTQDVTFSFKGDCIGLGQVDTTLALKRGWNAVDTDYFGNRTTYVVAPLPQMILPWTDSSAALQSLSLGKNALAPWKNLPQYQGR